MKIILLGYMGSGKTTLGKHLAQVYKLPFIDLDDYIEKKENASIEEIFKTKGEIYFRKQETFYLKELLLSSDSFVLSLGGGTPCFGNNMEYIIQHSKMVFYLKYQPKTLAERLLDEKNHRPLIAHLNHTNLEDFIRKHLFERNPYYFQAHHAIQMDELSIENSLEKLKNIIDNLIVS